MPMKFSGRSRPAPWMRRGAPAAALAVLAACAGSRVSAGSEGAVPASSSSPPATAAVDTVRNSPEARAARRNAPAQQGKPYVVMVSSDAFRWDFADLYSAPNLQRAAREGARGEMIPVFPSKTFPNHYALVTGMYAGHHGLAGNEIYDPATRAEYRISDSVAVRDPRWYGGEPLWVGAERQGMLSGVFFWPGSEAPIGGVLPTYVKAYDHEMPGAPRVDTILSWMRLPAERRPHYLALYFADVDDAAHRHGPRSPETARAVARVDSLVGRLLDGIARLPQRDSVTLVFVADHGMAEVHGERVFLADYLALDGVKVVSGGTYAQLFFHGDSARAEQAYATLSQRLPHGRVYRRGHYPPPYHYDNGPRTGDLLVVMEAPWQVAQRRRPDDGEGGAPMTGGQHGYDPALRDMHASFFALGPAVRPGARPAPFENVHVYPLVMHVLGLRPNPEADGRLEVLRPVLRP